MFGDISPFHITGHGRLRFGHCAAVDAQLSEISFAVRGSLTVTSGFNRSEALETVG
jgi:hypothetical protein